MIHIGVRIHWSHHTQFLCILDIKLNLFIVLLIQRQFASSSIQSHSFIRMFLCSHFVHFTYIFNCVGWHFRYFFFVWNSFQNSYSIHCFRQINSLITHNAFVYFLYCLAVELPNATVNLRNVLCDFIVICIKFLFFGLCMPIYMCNIA